MPTQTALVLGPADHDRPLTAEEFESADYKPGYKYEIIHGRLYVSPLPDLPEDRLEQWLFGRLFLYSQQHSEVINHVTPKARIFLPGEAEDVTRPEPDIAAYQGFPHHLPIAQVDWRNVSPLLVVEVVSSDPDKDLVRNVDLYLRVPSIKEYWILDPREDADHPTLLVYRRRGSRWQRPITVPAGGTYTTKWLPDFALLVDPHA
jgi:Uma2 family endonuclease